MNGWRRSFNESIRLRRVKERSYWRRSRKVKNNMREGKRWAMETNNAWTGSWERITYTKTHGSGEA